MFSFSAVLTFSSAFAPPMSSSAFSFKGNFINMSYLIDCGQFHTLGCCRKHTPYVPMFPQQLCDVDETQLHL